MSHVRIAPQRKTAPASRIASAAPTHPRLRHRGGASETALNPRRSRRHARLRQRRFAADGEFREKPRHDFEMNAIQGTLRDAVRRAATSISSTPLHRIDPDGDSIATNSFMLGFAFQKGAIPLSRRPSCARSKFNGAAIEMNKQAHLGRLAPRHARVRSVIQFRTRAASPTRTLDEMVAYRANS